MLTEQELDRFAIELDGENRERLIAQARLAAKYEAAMFAYGEQAQELAAKVVNAEMAGPAWRDKPTSYGRWMSSGGIVRYIADERDVETAAAICDQWFGPIPKPPKKGGAAT